MSWALVLTWVSSENVRVWVGRREGLGYLATTFALKEHYPPSIIVIARIKNGAVGFAMFLLEELLPKWKYVRFEFFEGDCSANFEWIFPKRIT